ncbi:MAG TPA: sigma-70 family RNA polymerase sigma factor [Thermoanaerobaculia bacterium]|nr:sigma-70 family RNA polymerase sigma factor [Thermoanaerobaculia bacterium]
MTINATSNIERLLPRWRAVSLVIGRRALSPEETRQKEKRYQIGEEGSVSFDILTVTPATLLRFDMANELLAIPDTEADDQDATAYREHYSLLLFIVGSRFRVPGPDAENIVHDVFLRFLRNRMRVHDERAWLVAAACNAARDYWRAPARREGGEMPERSISPGDGLAASIDVAELMETLPEKCRELLRLRYCDGCSAEELASTFSTTSGYAKLMVHRCLTAARALLVSVRRAE